MIDFAFTARYNFAQALTVTEAIIGVLFIAILMARLVGVYSADAARGEPQE